VARAHRDGNRRWWAYLTQAELDEVFSTADDERVLESQLPGWIVDAVCSFFEHDNIFSNVRLLKAMRADYRKAEREHRAALKAAKRSAAA
jgi:hypothetical protein